MPLLASATFTAVALTQSSKRSAFARISRECIGRNTARHNYEMKSIRVLIADDHALVRAGIRALVERIKGVAVVGEAGTGSEALELIDELQPNLILLDITMPDGSGFDVLEHVAK